MAASPNKMLYFGLAVEHALRELRSGKEVVELQGVKRDGEDHARAVADTFAEALAFNTTTVAVRWCTAGEYGARALAEALTMNATLQRLDLTHSMIGDEGHSALAGMLKTNTSLRSLDLSATNKLGREGALALAGALEVNNSLQTLDLTRAGTSSESIQILALGLQRNSALINLLLGFSFSDVAAATALARMLEVNMSLTNLDLQGNEHLKDEGVSVLAGALKKNNTLTMLSLERVNMKEQGFRALADALEVNSSLEILDVRDNYFSSKSALVLLEALKKAGASSSLQELLVMKYNDENRLYNSPELSELRRVTGVNRVRNMGHEDLAEKLRKKYVSSVEVAQPVATGALAGLARLVFGSG